jgi:hypothetical protein
VRHVTFLRHSYGALLNRIEEVIDCELRLAVLNPDYHNPKLIIYVHNQPTCCRPLRCSFFTLKLPDRPFHGSRWQDVNESRVARVALAPAEPEVLDEAQRR